MLHTEVLQTLKALANPENVKGMARFGINPKNTYGVSVPNLRKIARKAGKSHRLAGQLWKSGVHEARIVAAMVDEPGKVSEQQMERWASDFDSWDMCDQVCSNLFDKTGFAHKKVEEWSSRKDEFIKRAGFALMAALAAHDKKAKDDNFLKFLMLIKNEAADERNFVKKAVNWALRQIGKRNLRLNAAAIKTAKEIQKTNSKAARWVAADAIRELASEAVRKRLEAAQK